MDNKSIAELFLEMAELLDIEGGDPYRARTFRRVSHLLEELPEPVADALRFGALQRRRGIGEGTLRRLREILRTGACRDLERLRSRTPTSVRELLRLDGLGPKTVRLLHTYLGVRSVDELEAAINAGQLKRLPRFGPGLTEKILASIAEHRLGKGRIPLGAALRLGDAIVAGLSAHPAVEQAALTGSARRGKDLIGDLDVLAASSEPALVADRFCALPEVEQIMQRGSTRTAARLVGGVRIDLRVIVPETFGAGLHYFTGSKRHNIAVRARGNRRGLKISEYGVFERTTLRRLAGGAEADVFAAIGLPFIAPELREDDGELEAAQEGRLPQLVELSDLRGDLGAHTRASDGIDSAAAMAEAAAARGLSYLVLADHACSPGRSGASGASLLARRARVHRLAERFPSLRVLAGCEVEILPDGELALDPSLLARLDWVTASVHDHLDQSPAEMTKRLVRAIESGVVDCIGHPTGRRLGQREPLPLELEAVLGAARRCSVALELNARPLRLDLPAGACREARAAGVAIALSSGAHSTNELDQLRLGAMTARRGWLEKHDVLNCLTVEELVDRRQERLRTAWHAARAARPHALQVTRLVGQLAPPVSEEIRQRLHAWLGSGSDAELAAALGQLSSNPLRKALELLCHAEASLE